MGIFAHAVIYNLKYVINENSDYKFNFDFNIRLH